jgi:Ca2+-binding RTX toxin-like protein
VEPGGAQATFPDVTALADGRFVVTYGQYAVNTVRGHIYEADGTSAGSPFTIGVAALNALQQQVQTAALDDGRFVTVWVSTAGNIAGQVMFADGTLDGAAFTVNGDAAGDKGRPTIATLADGRFAVSWESGVGAAKTIFTTIFDPREAGLFGAASSLDDDWHGTGFGDTVFMGFGNDRMSAAAGNDAIYGETGTDTILGEAGNDQLFGGSGGDILNGGVGNDTLQGGLGNDTMTGGGGNDTFFIEVPGDIIIEASGLAAGNADKVASSNLSIDLAVFANVENAQILSAAALSLTGNAGGNVLTGGSGVNTINGLGANDILTGGKGRDIMTGGTGLDDFDFNALNETGKTGATRDRITDFTHLQDDIDLRTIDAKSGIAGNQAFKFIGGQSFHHIKGELHVIKQNFTGTANDRTIIEGDITGDGKADFQIELKGLIGLTSADFFL